MSGENNDGDWEKNHGWQLPFASPTDIGPVLVNVCSGCGLMIAYSSHHSKWVPLGNDAFGKTIPESCDAAKIISALE